MSRDKLPTNLSKEHIVRLFEAVCIPKIAVAMFIACMCGLRVNEARKLEQADINLQERKLFVRNSKNPNRSKEGYGKDRYVPIPLCAVSPIKKWLSIVEGQSKWFLPSHRSSEIPVSKEYLEDGFANARQRAGLNSVEYEIKYKEGSKSKAKGRNQFHFKWHSLRHFYATYVYERTRDLYAVQKLLGHKRVDTTQVYAKISDKVMKESVDFAFNMPIKTQVFEKNPTNALNFNIPDIAKKEKTNAEILEERFARGEISAVDFQTALRLLKIRKEYLDNETKTTEQPREAEYN